MTDESLMEFYSKSLNQLNELLNLDILNHIDVDNELQLIFESKEKDQAILKDLDGTPLISDLKLSELENFTVHKYSEMVQNSTLKDITPSSQLRKDSA